MQSMTIQSNCMHHRIRLSAALRSQFINKRMRSLVYRISKTILGKSESKVRILPINELNEHMVAYSNISYVGFEIILQEHRNQFIEITRNLIARTLYSTIITDVPRKQRSILKPIYVGGINMDICCTIRLCTSNPDKVLYGNIDRVNNPVNQC